MPSPAEHDDRGLGPTRFPGPPPQFAMRAALRLNRFIHRLADRMIPAQFVLFELAIGINRTATVGAFARFGVADLLEARAQTGAEIAAAIGTDPDATHRWLRGLAWEGVIRLDRDGRFRNTRVSRTLLPGVLSRSRPWASYFGSPSNLRAYLAFEHTLRTGKNGFEHAHGQGVWDWFDAHPDERESSRRR